MQLAIVSQGEELLSGETIDTNSAWLAAEATTLGIPARRMVTAGDSVDDIRWALQAAAEAGEIILCTGGLGPTRDDLTAEAVAAWAGVGLVENKEALAQIEARYAHWGRVMSPTNAKQAHLPAGAELLANPMGTAPGFHLEHAGCHLFCMPGVPREMRPMFLNHVGPWLDSLREGDAPTVHHIRTIGVAESQLAQMLGDLDLSPARLGFRCHMPEVIVKLVFPPDTPAQLRKQRLCVVIEAIPRGVYSVDGGDLAEVIGEALAERGQTLALAESCTTGGLAAWIGSVPGASRYLLEGAVVYANQAKTRTCGVSEADLQESGAVSEPVARQLACGIRKRAGATWGIGITGVAGPGGGTEQKPVGTVHIAVAGPHEVVHHRFRIPGDRAQIAGRSAGMALGMLFEQLELTAYQRPAEDG